MRYEKNVQYIISVIDKVLLDLEKPKLLENSDFKFLFKQYFDYIGMTLKKNMSIRVDIHISTNSLEFHLDRTSETYTYDMKFIKENEEYIRNIITMIFTCSIKVEYCGENYTKLYFINKEGKTLNTFSFTTGLLGFFGLISKKNCKEKLYPPIYPSEKICLTEPVIPNK